MSPRAWLGVDWVHRHTYQARLLIWGSSRPSRFPEGINASPHGHEDPGESQPRENPDKDDERKDEHGRLVATPTVILAQAGTDNAQDGGQKRALRRPRIRAFFGPQPRQVD